jgi:hypothetical protein
MSEQADSTIPILESPSLIETSSTTTQPVINLIAGIDENLLAQHCEVESGYTTTFLITVKKSAGYSRNKNLLVRSTGKYIIPNEGQFYYYPIAQPVPNGDHLFKLPTPPRVHRAGFVSIDGCIYYVTLEDLKRRLVRKSRIVPLKKQTIPYDDFANNNFKPTPRGAGSLRSLLDLGVGDPSTETENGNGTVDFVGLDELQAIDLVIESQERALFGHLDKEESDFEITESA